MSETKQPAITEILQAHQGERHVVVIQDYPDPDAISSALAHQLISQPFDIEVDIIYSGKISHQENIALVRLLEIDLTHYSEAVDLDQYQGAVFVDNQGTTSSEIMQALEKAEIPALIVVDHHEQQERLKPEFSDIRSTGAAASIYAEYLEQGLIEMSRSEQLHIKVATALMHGIMTDTGYFLQAKPEDFYAAAFLSQFTDADLLGQIMNQSRSRQVMDVIEQVLRNRIVAESYSIAGIGYLRAENRDAIPQAADFLLSEENVHTAIVYGIVTGEKGDEKLIGSFRTSKITVSPDEFIKNAFGKNQIGQYFGGGKMAAGGFEVPIGFLSGDGDDSYQELKWQVYDKQIKQKIFTKIGVEQEN